MAVTGTSSVVIPSLQGLRGYGIDCAEVPRSGDVQNQNGASKRGIIGATVAALKMGEAGLLRMRNVVRNVMVLLVMSRKRVQGSCTDGKVHVYACPSRVKNK